MTGQFCPGFKEHNKERSEDGQPRIPVGTYLSSGHFLQATFENWESEFLQMALFVVLTISLRQKGLLNLKSLNLKKWTAGHRQLKKMHPGRYAEVVGYCNCTSIL
jgi:hypothetical protein